MADVRDLKMEVHCDMSELDSALDRMETKLNRLLQKSELLNHEFGEAVPGVLVATSLLASPRKFSRRSLFGLLRRR